MVLSLALILSDTGAEFPRAYGRIDDSLLNLSSGLLKITLNWFATQTVSNNRRFRPIRVDSLDLPASTFLTPNPTFVIKLQEACNNGTIITPQDALKTALYILVQQQAGYENAVFI